MTIATNNGQATLTWLDSFKYTWHTSDQSAIPAFFSSVNCFFRGRTVCSKDLDNYINTHPDLPSDNIFSRVRQIITRNITIFHSKTSPSGAVGFKNHGNTCFINTSLKCVLEAFGNEFINDRVNNHNAEKTRLEEQLSNADPQNENGKKEFQDKLNELNKKDHLVTAFGFLSRSYFNPGSFEETNNELLKFIDEMYHYGQNHEDHFFKKIFSENTSSHRKYKLLQNSSAEMIIALLPLITDKSSESAYAITLKTTLNYEFRDQHDTLQATVSRVNALEPVTYLYPQIVPGQTIQQGLDNSLQPNKRDAEPKSFLKEFDENQKQKIETTPQENCTRKILTTDNYSGDLNKLKCLIVNPGMHVRTGPHLMAKLDENIVLPIIHHGEEDHHGQCINDQLYHVELQPQAIFLHHGGDNGGHKSALIREGNGSFSEHDDALISSPRKTLSEFPRNPEGVIYKVISITPATEIAIPGENTIPNPA